MEKHIKEIENKIKHTNNYLKTLEKDLDDLKNLSPEHKLVLMLKDLLPSVTWDRTTDKTYYKIAEELLCEIPNVDDITKILKIIYT